MNAGSNITETTDLSTFGFLYGTFPAAPGVFVIATQYNVDIDLVSLFAFNYNVEKNSLTNFFRLQQVWCIVHL